MQMQIWRLLKRAGSVRDISDRQTGTRARHRIITHQGPTRHLSPCRCAHGAAGERFVLPLHCLHDLLLPNRDLIVLRIH
jgi:hypothetical protein